MITRRAFLRTCGLTGLALSTPAWAAAQAQPLFDGQSLKGWHKPPKKIGHGTGGHWGVEDGVLLGEQDPPGSGNGGLLLSDEKFGDFDLQLDKERVLEILGREGSIGLQIHGGKNAWPAGTKCRWRNLIIKRL